MGTFAMTGLLALVWTAAGAEPPPRVAVFREPGFPASGAPSSPDVLARACERAGAQVRFLDARGLADPTVLDPREIDIVILPCGRSFPAAARESFLAYLRGGGDFISTGGYAFQDLLLKEQLPDGGWNYGIVIKSQPGRSKSYGAMTAAGVASLYLTRDYLYPSLGCPCQGGHERWISER